MKETTCDTCGRDFWQEQEEKDCGQCVANAKKKANKDLLEKPGK